METLQKYIDCSDFLGGLIPLGLTASFLPVAEEAYWTVLQERSAGHWEGETAFRGPGSNSIDFAKCAEAFATLGSSASDPVFSDAFYSLLYGAAGLGPRPPEGEVRQKLRKFSMGTFLRCASFVAIARRAGVYQENQSKLEMMTVGAVMV